MNSKKNVTLGQKICNLFVKIEWISKIIRALNRVNDSLSYYMSLTDLCSDVRYLGQVTWPWNLTRIILQVYFPYIINWWVNRRTSQHDSHKNSWWAIIDKQVLWTWFSMCSWNPIAQNTYSTVQLVAAYDRWVLKPAHVLMKRIEMVDWHSTDDSFSKVILEK